MAEQDLDRNEEATPYKLQKAREKGQVSKSTDVVSTAVLAVAVIYLTWQGWASIRQQFRFDQALLAQAGRAGSETLWPLVAQTIHGAISVTVPIFATMMVTAILSNVLQTGPVFAWDAVAPDFDRINPTSGFQRVFSQRIVFNTAKAFAKLLLLLCVAYYALKSLAPQFYSLASLSPVGYIHTLLDDMASLGLKMVLILVVIALIDLIFSRREFAKKMRMSKRELTQESKNRDGDPRIRARLRELRREMLKRSRSLQQTKNADVLLTNPTHIAVALRYVHGEMTSPQLIAKGSGHLAAAMREIAAQHRIPVVQSPSLARKLFKELDVKHYIPPHLFNEVARIIVWVFAMRDRQRGRASQQQQGTSA